MEKVRIAFDVGGTFSKGMIFSESGKELLNGIAVYESHSEEAAPFIMNNFLFMISDLCGQLFKEPVVLLSLGLAFPGPFDYEAGVSLIKNLEKFDSLYRVNIKKELMEVLRKSDLTLSENFTIYFEMMLLVLQWANIVKMPKSMVAVILQSGRDLVPRLLSIIIYSRISMDFLSQG